MDSRERSRRNLSAAGEGWEAGPSSRPPKEKLMDGLEGSEQGWVLNSKAGCRNHPTRPQPLRRRLDQKSIFSRRRIGDQVPG